jgi:hypothetical protein
MSFHNDVIIRLDEWKDRQWQLWWTRHVLNRYTHILLEQGLSACGWLHGKFFFGDAPILHAHGIQTGLVFRGSEIRDPAAHAERHRWSPFSDADHPLTRKLQAHVGTLRPRVDEFSGPLFVTTLDLIDDLPRARWLPHVLDLDFWRAGPPVFERDVPTVLHAPSRERMKGSSYVDAVCQPLADAGVIVYDRLRGVPFHEMPDRIRRADVVIDQLALGSYGVLAAQAMATGRIVMGHVGEHVRKRLQTDLPIVEATPDQLGRTLEELLAARASVQGIADAGRRYVEDYHSGPRSAAVLSDFVGGTRVEPSALRGTSP